jgi:hypothetical protein
MKIDLIATCAARSAQDNLCSMLKVPREEAELWWYAEVGAACNRSADLPRVPAQVD